MRVLVTGVGIVSPLGSSARATMDRLVAGDCAIRRLTRFSLPGLAVDLAAEVDLSADEETPEGAPPAPRSSFPRRSRADAMAVAAAREALAQGGLAGTADVELVVAGSTGGMFECEEVLALLKRDIDADVPREVLAMHPLSAAADRIHEALGPFARTRAVCSACSGGATAIALAARAIRTGRIERALAGGVDALCRLTYAGFAALGAIDRAPCRPFDKSRAGLSLGEGAAFLLLESEASARARGRRALAELGGWALASEAHHITHPEPSGATAGRVMRAAIADAGLDVADVDYVNAHGTATPHNDPMEAAAIELCFGADARRVAVSSVKGAIGHTLGAAGAIEAAVTVLAVAEQRIPPTVGLSDPDPACALHHVRRAERGPVRAALSNAFGFGGADTTLVFRRWPRDDAPPAVVTPRVAPPTLAITGAACFGPLGLHGTGAGCAPLAGALAYTEPGPLPPDVPLELPAGLLDPMRARRLDRASRMATVVVAAALGPDPDRARLADPRPDQARLADARVDRGGVGQPALDRGTGVVVGTAHGSVGATGQLLRRIVEVGARFASPAVFPSVLPSAVASQPSIYLGLVGPVLSCSDLSTSAEAALAIAAELVESGECDKMVAAAVDEHNLVAARISGPLTSGIADRSARTEGAAAVAVERLADAGSRALATIAWWRAWRGAAPELPPPRARSRAVVLSARPCSVPTSWRGVPRQVVADRAGDHESAGGVALVAAVAALCSPDGGVDEVLVLGAAPDRGYAWALTRPPPPAEGTRTK